MGTREGKLTQAVVPSVAGCGGLHTQFLTPRAARTHANARRRRVSHRAPALRPHPTHQISTRVRCAHNLGRDFFDIFGPQISAWGLAPRRASQFCRSGLAGQAGGGQQEGGRRGGAGPFLPNSMYSVSVALRATRCLCVEWRHRFHSHSALCRTPHHANACARAYGRGEGGLRVRSHCWSR